MALKKIIVFFISIGIQQVSHANLDTSKNHNSFSQIISADATASSAIDAKKKALEEAENGALDKLSLSLNSGQLLEEGLPMKPIAPNDLKSFIAGYEVLKEKNSSTRYLATLRYTFDEDALKRLLKEKDIKILPPPKEKLLLIPFFHKKQEDSSLSNLWEDNPWHETWHDNRELLSAYLPIVLPLNDLEDITTLQPQDAVDGLYPAFEKMQKRYNTLLGTIIVVAEPQFDYLNLPPPLENEASSNNIVVNTEKTTHPSTDQQKLLSSITVYLLHGFTNTDGKVPVFSLTKNIGESDKEFYKRAALEAIKELAHQWKKKPIQKAATPIRHDLDVTLVFNTPHRWFSWEKTLDNLVKTTNLTAYEIKQLSSKKAQIHFQYVGEVSIIQRQLKRQGLSLNNVHNQWFLQND